MPSIPVKDFSLVETMESGQYFAYEEKDGKYEILLRDLLFEVWQEGSALYYEGISEDALVHFFRLDEDHGKTLSVLSKDKHLKKAVAHCRGIRLLRQDPWQCTVGFLCSQNSNIPRIKGNIQSMVENFGGGKFPKPGSLSDAGKLKLARLGYREKYILGTNSLVSDKFFEDLRKLSYDEAKEKLMELPGIGPKVADCVLLFSLDFLGTFPVDVWMFKGMKHYYSVESMKDIQSFADEKWGEYAGYAQQYLYHWFR
ncbi:MAG: DNA glycosylase, partial [Candidatus Nanoarchaeia archaeon]